MFGRCDGLKFERIWRFIGLLINCLYQRAFKVNIFYGNIFDYKRIDLTDMFLPLIRLIAEFKSQKY